jgi:hypothetical protein
MSRADASRKRCAVYRAATSLPSHEIDRLKQALAAAGLEGDDQQPSRSERLI